RLPPSRKMARCGPAEPFLASTAQKTGSSALLKGEAGAWGGRSGGDANPQESSGNNLGSFGTLTQKIKRCTPRGSRCPPWGRILTLPPEISPSPRQPSAGRGLGRGASTGLQTWAAVAFRQGGLLSPALSSKGGEGGPVVGWWQCQDARAPL